MTSTGTGREDTTVRRADEQPAAPWHDFGQVMEQMLDLLQNRRPPDGGRGRRRATVRTRPAPEAGR
ncbi:hypothetical protein ACSHWO_02115 [Streptomyces sp. HUAS TT3]|uniref:hypothetical protein n=1 Tax=Streptomyces sp. HUAS TT3 TaxID=3447510 RepID=UPI003F657EE2